MTQAGRAPRSFRPPEVQHRKHMSPSRLIAADVAELLGLPKSWVYEQSRTGGIPTVTLH